MIELIKMDEEKFNLFAKDSQVRRQNWYIECYDLSKNEAHMLAKADFDRIVTNGINTKDNFTYSLINKDGDDVGYLWYTLRKDGVNRKAFICDLLVAQAYRGKGYGKKSILMLEEQVKAMGINKIGLHVIASNSVAFGLYKSVGYEVQSYLMDKNLF